jgi:hypothetical protein
MLPFAIIFILASCLYAGPYKLDDRVCVLVPEQRPILKSGIGTLSKEKSISFDDAKMELIRSRLLWIYAKNNPKYDVNQFYQLANDHIKGILKERNLTLDQLAEILKKPPYQISIDQFIFDTATAYLKQAVIAAIASQINVSEEDIKKWSESRATEYDKFDIIFITINLKNKKEAILKAWEIRKAIISHKSIDAITKKYQHDPSISIIGPIQYEVGNFSPKYEDEIKKIKTNEATKPFNDQDSVSLIWKIKTQEPIGRSSLEKIRNDIYDYLVTEKYKSLTHSLMNTNTVDDKGCEQ